MKTKMLAVCIGAFLFCGVAQADLNDGVVTISSNATDIPMNLSDWKDYNPYGDPSNPPPAKIEETTDGIKIYGAGYRMGRNMVSKSTYNFSSGGSVDFKWRVSGGGGYSGYFVGLLLSDPSKNTVGPEFYNYQNLAIAAGLTTDHSYNGSTLISENTWYYSTVNINADHSSSATTSINGYAKNGGTIIRNDVYPPVLSDYEWSFIENAYLAAGLGDNYGGTSAWMEIAEVSINQGGSSNTQYTVSVAKTGQGTITSTPAGIDCGTTCESPFAAGTDVTLTATPASGYAFKGWGMDCTNTSGPCVLTLNADADVFASFKPSGYALNVVKVGSGTVTSAPAGINCGTDCSEKYATAGTSVTLTATPATGFAFSKWTGACTGTTPTCKVTLNAAKTVTATFAKLPDFVVTGVTLTPAAPPANSTFTATVTVKNQGATTADGGYLDVWTHSTATQSCDAEGNAWSGVGSVAAGATKLITINGLRAAENTGSRTLRAFVDSWCQTTESQETNNQFTTGYTVK